METGSNIDRPDPAATAVVKGMELYLPLGGLIDLDKERARLDKRKNEIETLLIGIQNKLNNDHFTKRAPQHIVEHERTKLVDLTDELKKVVDNLENL